mgnify:CR=1 FL=1|tara:strand:- start:30 stop:674 length:645 start_codon:yes stop_codon:yes gene_type:complete
MSQFNQRLIEACEASDVVPAFGRGQQTYIARTMGVSQEAVRKWFAGESIPRSKASIKLAKLLSVRHAWLVLGSSHGEIDDSIKSARRHESSIYALMAFCVQKGVGASFASESAATDLIVIDKGVLKNISTETAVRLEKGKYQVTFRASQIKEGGLVAFIHDFSTKHSAVVDYLEIDAGMVRKGKTVDSETTVQISMTRLGDFEVGGVKAKRFLD